MSDSLYWQVEGQGPNVVLLHGWGMNGAVWHQIVQALSADYRVYVPDLPGYGFSGGVSVDTLPQLAKLLQQQGPQQATWVGWSLGGLLATYLARYYPASVRQWVTVASSPKFAAAPGWKGMKPAVLDNFTTQLMDNFQLTIERFMALQTMGTPTASQDVKQLKQAVLSRPAPIPDALMTGLEMLIHEDLRAELAQIQPPCLRLYGRLDGLVPVSVADQVGEWMPASDSQVFLQSSHAPFITEPAAFVARLIEFMERAQ